MGTAVVELNERELRDINGGIAPIVIYLIVGGIALAGLGVGIYNGYKKAESENNR
ncbi:class IIb bacteriocin, lactobin A/cerein 7B family [Vulcanibacillus modesticaldus]|uniref:class IIb bacteriocin, lactobin A/cerein 7B family n=1 Tax=Vulcanibacillus modesticaldus TaxID=337097 RepID=UPI00159F0290|nr:class IIb bacteriocin, lactobin A/cerein 7B family [Vulcanibacillus modesticaldus]